MRFRWIIYATCMHYNARGILKRRMASVSLIYAQLEFAAECNRIRDCLAIGSNGRSYAG